MEIAGSRRTEKLSLEAVSINGARLCRRPAAVGWRLLRLACSTVALHFVGGVSIHTLSIESVSSLYPEPISYDDLVYMLKMPDSRLSAPSAEVISSSCFYVPMTLKSDARVMDMAFDALRGAFEEVKSYLPRLDPTIQGTELVAFDAAVGLSNVGVALRGKDHQIELTFALRCPIPPGTDFWDRVKLVAAVYEHLGVLVSLFEGRKGIDLYLDEARLEQPKTEAATLRVAS
jgi:hypothetical protein